MNLKIEDVAAQRSFVFIWCGSGEGLDLGRWVWPVTDQWYLYMYMYVVLYYTIIINYI